MKRRSIQPGVLCAGLLLALGTPGCGRSGTSDADAAGVHDRASGIRARADSRAALTDACRYLWARQQADGGWHSEMYAVLRSGQALTPFILHALLRVPEGVSPRPEGAAAKACTFIRTRINEDGAIGFADPDIIEYPNYATAFAIRALLLAGMKADDTDVRRMREYLVRQQYDETRGFSPDKQAYGGWGFGARKLSPAESGHMDISHTRCVLQALHEAGCSDTQVFGRARRLLQLVQREIGEASRQPKIHGEPEHAGQAPFDGGFYFSPVVLGANKGLYAPATATVAAYYKSYATPTCDGVLALLAAGVSANDARVTAARGWLEQHAELAPVPGIPTDQVAPWHVALHHYHLAVRAETYKGLGVQGTWSKDIAELLRVAQYADGHFMNGQSTLMKEDDPLLATALAVTALTFCTAESPSDAKAPARAD